MSSDSDHLKDNSLDDKDLSENNKQTASDIRKELSKFCEISFGVIYYTVNYS